MTAEEKILAYLDGSLSENESAELLHQLSVSPEKRVVLEQHLKLGEMTRAAQKPFEVPAELEEKLRRRLPIIIPSEAVAPVVVRRGALSSLLLLLRNRTTIRYSAAALLLMISVASVYLFTKNGQQNSEFSKNSTVISNNITSNPRVSVANEAPSSIATTAIESKKNTSVELNNKTSNAHELSSLLNSQQQTSNNPILPKHVKFVNPEVMNSRDEIPHDLVVNNSISEQSSSTAVTNGSSLGMIDIATVKTPEYSSISEGAIRERYKLNPFEMHSSNERTKWSVRLSVGMGETFLNVPSGKSTYTTRTETSPFASINYNISESFIVAAVVGNTSILTVSPQTATTTIDGLDHTVAHTYSTNSHEWFARLAARYSIPLKGSWSIEGSAEGGMLLASSSPMACIQLGVNQSLTDAFDVQFAVLGSGVWTTPQPIDLSTTSNPSGGPVFYRTESSTTLSKIFSPAITIRAGMQYRF